MADQTSGSGGIGFFGALGVLFIGLKLASIIDWNWWLVLAPLWGPPAFMLTVFIVAVILTAIFGS